MFDLCQGLKTQAMRESHFSEGFAEKVIGCFFRILRARCPL